MSSCSCFRRLWWCSQQQGLTEGVTLLAEQLLGQRYGGWHLGQVWALSEDMTGQPGLGSGQGLWGESGVFRAKGMESEPSNSTEAKGR